MLAWNGAGVLPSCLRSLAGVQEAGASLVCIDNGSTDRTREIIRAEAPGATLLENGRNLGFAAGMNRGIEHVLSETEPPEILILLNQDTIVAEDWLAGITAPFSGDKTIGAVGCKVHYPDGRLQHAGAGIDNARATAFHLGAGETDTGQYDTPRDVPYVTGAAIALRTRAIRQVGLLDEGFHPAYYEDVDLCLRLRESGWRILYEPAAVVEHQESTSTPDAFKRARITERHRLRYVLKNWSVDRIRETFVPAERAHGDACGEDLEMKALQGAYRDAARDSQAWVDARADSQELSPEDRAWLNSLGEDLADHLDKREPAAATAAEPAKIRLEAPRSALRIGETNKLEGRGFTSGSVIKVFVATGNGPTDCGPFPPSAWTPTDLTWVVPEEVPVGNGYATLQVVNTDEGYITSDAIGCSLLGSIAKGYPELAAIDGVARGEMSPAYPLNFVETVARQGATLTITGAGFDAPLVNLFSSRGNEGPLQPLAGAGTTRIQVVIPDDAPTGPGALVVVNTGAENRLSNAVSIPIGSPLSIARTTQLGRTVTVRGAGFSALSVINFFAPTARGVKNLGGFDSAGNPEIPLRLSSDTEITFDVPSAATSGNAFLEIHNPPYLPFSSASGAFVLALDESD